MHHHTELSLVEEFRWVSPLRNDVLLWCMLQAGPPSLHYYCAVVLHSCIVLTPVAHSSNHEYHCCQLTRQSSCVSNFYRTFKVFIWLSIVVFFLALIVIGYYNIAPACCSLFLRYSYARFLVSLLLSCINRNILHLDHIIRRLYQLFVFCWNQLSRRRLSDRETGFWHDFRPPPRNGREQRSSGLLRSV